MRMRRQHYCGNSDLSLRLVLPAQEGRSPCPPGGAGGELRVVMTNSEMKRPHENQVLKYSRGPVMMCDMMKVTLERGGVEMGTNLRTCGERKTAYVI